MGLVDDGEPSVVVATGVVDGDSGSIIPASISAETSLFVADAAEGRLESGGAAPEQELPSITKAALLRSVAR